LFKTEKLKIVCFIPLSIFSKLHYICPQKALSQTQNLKMIIAAQSIPEVISALDTIIEQSRIEKHRMGLFAALYRQVTRRVKHGIEQGRFDDGARMERLDVVFANRFLTAYQAYRAGQPLTNAWRVTFEAARKPNLFIIQHLLLGMNAHISLDLGIAAAEIGRNQPIADLEHDFNEINLLLTEMVNDVQRILDKNSLTWSLVDILAGKIDEHLAEFGIEHFRKRAWQVAQSLHQLNEAARADYIAEMDKIVTEESLFYANFGGSMLLPFVQVAARFQNLKAEQVMVAFGQIPI
jgi:hypothetical protein